VLLLVGIVAFALPAVSFGAFFAGTGIGAAGVAVRCSARA